ncbi:alanine aminotransferase 1-like isoform X1 [Schistocerca serialis cubense]|uniref:alanine aminotransferase 1-like isoform X1 n=1 Tax=Schistocerca serialis cubense TaxID=2023355 RepID=UPI00214E7B99|nr:alanine aminotransferase 1-like isoform X1 [Schistocerca serialis cubense]
MVGISVFHSVRTLKARNAMPIYERVNWSAALYMETEAVPPHTARNMMTASSIGGDRPSRRAKSVTLETLNPCIKEMQYGITGPLVNRASKIEKELEKGVKKPFTEVIKANIGDCHSLGQVPITFVRQVLAMVSYPVLLDDPRFPYDVKYRVKEILASCPGGSVGSYPESAGTEVIRRHVAEFIERRDGAPSSWEDIVMTCGATTGIKMVLYLLIGEMNGKKAGVMTPIPQYPIYSATLSEFNMVQIPYYLEEESCWGLDLAELQRAIDEARKVCNPRAIVIINPGNPTGQVLSRNNIEEIIKFAYQERLFILADEVYQDNVYAEESKFYSFKKVMMEMGPPYSEMEMASFMSASKGYLGECGLRGGYCELINLEPDVKAMCMKSFTVMSCPTVPGQVAIDCVVKPPQPGDPSYEQFTAEKESILNSLSVRAKTVVNVFNSLEGMSCNKVQGAMYAFPQLHLPPNAIKEAKQNNLPPDAFYALGLLEDTGITVVPGSEFGQKPGTYHFRTTILPQHNKLKSMMNKIKAYHDKFMQKYG